MAGTRTNSPIAARIISAPFQSGPSVLLPIAKDLLAGLQRLSWFVTLWPSNPSAHWYMTNEHERFSPDALNRARPMAWEHIMQLQANCNCFERDPGLRTRL